MGQIIDQGFALGRGKLIGDGLLGGMGVAMHALQVAFSGNIPDHHRPFVFGKLQQVGGQGGRVASITEGIRWLNGSTV